VSFGAPSKRGIRFPLYLPSYRGFRIGDKCDQGRDLCQQVGYPCFVPPVPIDLGQRVEIGEDALAVDIQENGAMYVASTWILPLLIAITFHEAAHGFAARLLGDDTALRLGRVTLNPLKHIDPFGTVLLPALLFLLRSPFLFGYAKPVPVNFRALRNPRRGMALVAAAGPATNIALAILAALLFHVIRWLPPDAARWVADNLRNALIINVILAVFNMFPLPPLDGGRIAVGLLPEAMGRALARLEPYGMAILIGLLFILPLIGAQIGIDLRFVSHLINLATAAIIDVILRVTGGL
jgi:Zn-dependent protease